MKISQNRISEISGVFLKSEEVDLISDLAKDSSLLIVRLLKEIVIIIKAIFMCYFSREHIALSDKKW